MNKAIHTISRFKIILPVATLSLLTILSAFTLSSPRSSAETRKLNAAVHVPDTCSMNAVDSGTATVDNPYEMIGGMYVDNISSTTINITCNDRNGYSLYAVGYGNGDVGNTNMIGHESGNIIPTGTVSDGSVSNWSFRLTPISGVYTPSILSDTNGSFTSNHIIPSTDTKIATFTGDIDASAESSLTATYAVGVEHYQTPDIYTGQVRYTLVHPNYTNADGTTESYPVTLTLNNAESIIIDGTTYTTSSATPSLTYGTHTISGTYPANYEFDNWSSTGSISITSASTASTTMTVTGAGTLTLNAKSSCASSVSGTMQAFDPTKLCSTAGTSGTLTDSRGGTTKSYTVAKLADGKWWMTTNLDLPGGTTVTSADSDVTTDYTLPASATKNADDNNLTDTDSTQFSNSSTDYVFNSGNNINCGASEQNTPCGSYYSYLAATAGTGSSVATYNNASGSICPKGWRLPTITTSNANPQTNNNWKTGDFYALATAYGANLESNYYDSSSATSANFYNNAGPGTTSGFLLAGYYDYAKFYYGGSLGRYWSSTAGSTYYAYNLNFTSSNVESARDSSRRSGFSVRCVFGE